jgi:hypothetical protein
MERTKAGPYYKYKLEGVHIGDSVESRVNIENMVYHRYLVVGKVRAGGFYMLIGSVDSPCDSFDPDFSTGNGPADTSQTKFVFTTDHISKAYILPSFAADTLAAGDGSNGNGGNGNMANQREIITFNNVPSVNIPWTNSRNGKFGSMPLIEVWLDDGVNPPFLSFGGSIECDQQPPAMTEINVRIGAAATGFIIIG